LNSLSIGQIVAESARRLGLPRPASPTEYSHATLGEIARTLEELRRTGATAPTQDVSRFAAGVDSWVRTFTVQLKERPAPPAPERSEQGTWQIIGPPDNALTNSLKATFAHAGGSGGVVVHLPQQPDEMAVAFLLDGAQRVLARSGSPTFVLVQHGGGGGA